MLMNVCSLLAQYSIKEKEGIQYTPEYEVAELGKSSVLISFQKANSTSYTVNIEYKGWTFREAKIQKIRFCFRDSSFLSSKFNPAYNIKYDGFNENLGHCDLKANLQVSEENFLMFCKKRLISISFILDGQNYEYSVPLKRDHEVAKMVKHFIDGSKMEDADIDRVFINNSEQMIKEDHWNY